MMMLKNNNKLSIVAAFILGTTMLSSVDKAWGMNQEEADKLSSSSKITIALSNEDRLVGKIRVSAEVYQAAQDLLTDLSTSSDAKSLSVEGTPSRKAIRSLVHGGIGKVMAEQGAVDPDLDSCIINSLKAILVAEKDPYGIIISGKDKPKLTAKPKKKLREMLVNAKRKGVPELEGLFRSTLPHIVDSYSTIIDSLFARFPQENEQMKSESQQISRFKEYFGIQTPASSVSAKPLTKRQLVDQARTQKVQQEKQQRETQEKYNSTLNELAEAFYFLQQIEKDWDLSNHNSIPSPAPVIPEPVQPFSSSSGITPSLAVEEAPRFTYRTTGATLAKNKHSAVAIQLSDEDLKYPAYKLTVKHRTGENGSSVRIFIPGIDYSPLGGLPSSVGFEDKDFDLSPWVEAVRGDSSSPSAIKTFLSFVGGQSDVHSFKIRSGERTLKEVILGDPTSESQPGIHVYAPETDGDANEWSGVKYDDVQQ